MALAPFLAADDTPLAAGDTDIALLLALRETRSLTGTSVLLVLNFCFGELVGFLPGVFIDLARPDLLSIDYGELALLAEEGLASGFAGIVRSFF